VSTGPSERGREVGPVVEGDVEAEGESGSRAGEPGWLGVELLVTPAGTAGVLVREVLRGSPAERVDLKSGDVLLRVHGQAVSKPADVARLVGERGAGRRLNLVLRRGTEQHLVAVRLGSVPTPDELLRGTYVGAMAPPLQALTAARGRPPLSLRAVRGRVTLVEFWSPWCQVCRMLIPVMNDWHERYQARGVKFVAITTVPVPLAAQAAAGLGMDCPVASDESERTTLAYRALALPTLFVIDPEGKVRDVMVGYSRRRMRQVESLIEQLLGASRQSESERGRAGVRLVSAPDSR
jgi:thiol-disulfide isomerase/thioredoxin